VIGNVERLRCTNGPGILAATRLAHIAIPTTARPTVARNARAPFPISKAIKRARKPVTLDAYGITRATVSGNDNANPTHPNTPALLTELA